MLDDLKNYLQITWEDEETNKRVSGILSRATALLNKYAGVEIDFDKNEDERQLLFDCCRYIYNNSLAHFEKDFSGDLISLRAQYAVEGYLNDQAEVSDV